MINCQRSKNLRFGEGRKTIAMLDYFLWISNIVPKTKCQFYGAVLKNKIMLYIFPRYIISWNIPLIKKNSFLLKWAFGDKDPENKGKEN